MSILWPFDLAEAVSVWRGSSKVENNSLLEIVNRRSGNLVLQCIEHGGQSDLTWFVLPDNGTLTTPSAGKEGDTFRADISGNQATLTIVNSMEPFRGLLRCSSSAGVVVNIRVVAGRVYNMVPKKSILCPSFTR